MAVPGNAAERLRGFYKTWVSHLFFLAPYPCLGLP